MNRLEAKPGNMIVELVGGPHDGRALEVPLWAEVVWLRADDVNVFAVTEPVANLAFTMQVRYEARGRCANLECKYHDRTTFHRTLLDHEKRQKA